MPKAPDQNAGMVGETSELELVNQRLRENFQIMCNANGHFIEANKGLLETIDELRATYVRTANERDTFEKMVLAMKPRDIECRGDE
jgi:hypothetical protein